MKAHGGLIDIEGVVVAKVNEKLQLEKIDVWFDPMSMFRQMKDPQGAKEALDKKQEVETQEAKDSEKLNAE
jgi:hypothetical protein